MILHISVILRVWAAAGWLWGARAELCETACFVSECGRVRAIAQPWPPPGPSFRAQKCGDVQDCGCGEAAASVILRVSVIVHASGGPPK